MCLQVTERELEIDVRLENLGALPGFLRGKADIERVFIRADFGHALVIEL